MNARGFTLVELLVAIVVMSMLALLSWRSLDKRPIGELFRDMLKICFNLFNFFINTFGYISINTMLFCTF